MDWLLTPIDPGRTHDVVLAQSWHGRCMGLAWGVLAPLAVIVARFFKVLPGQNWPRDRDNRAWWRAHWIGHTLVAMLSLAGLVLVARGPTPDHPHGRLGFVLLVLLAVQIAVGLLRGSKGGPTAPAPDGSPRGDHYDMTRRRVLFEHMHKSLGYLLLVLSVPVLLLGLWTVNAPRWIWAAFILWWASLCVLGMVLQSRGRAIDTYQAIWGPDPAHPGNRRDSVGWGMRRLKGDGNVRSD